MSFASTRWLPTIGALACLLAVAACGDDDPVAPDPTPDPLGTPASVSGTSTSPTSIRITWAAVTGATSYDVEQATGSGAFTSAGSVSTTEYTASGLAPETEYRFRVRATRAGEQSSFSSEAVVSTADRATVQVTADITSNTTWTSDNIYQLTRVISVANGATLTIEPGTRIIGGNITPGSAPPVVALMVLRGSRINAVGTAADPIIMTSAAAPGERGPGDWGGLIIVGNATSNRTGRTVVEGPTPADTVSWNGGNLDNDNSGELRYVRVEFAGAAAQLNVELNSFSFYAVGNSTRLEYLQAIRGLDDQFEWFGGTVDARYLVSYESGDDHFDAAEGYRGRNQYLIALQTGPRVQPGAGNPGALASDQNGFEQDGCGSTGGGCADGFNSTPYSMPVWANFSIVGPGPGVVPVRPNGDGGVGAVIRRGAGGVYVNGVLARWPESAMSIFDQPTDDRLSADSLNIRNLVMADNGRSFDAVGANNRFGQESKFTNNEIRTSAAAAHTLFANVPAVDVTIANGTSFDWRPATGSILTTGGTGGTFPGRIPNRVANFFGGTLTGTSYIGAIDPAATSQWYDGWTTYYRN